MCQLFDDLVQRFEIPSQGCVLTHVTNNLKPMEDGVPVDLVFQSLGGSEITNRSFGVAPELRTEVCEAARALELGGVGDNVMYFEAGQGSALLANGHGGVDQQTCEARAYGLARCYELLLVNTVVGLIGPEYLYDGKQIVRAGLEDRFCGKLLGPPGLRHLLHQPCRGRSGRHGYAQPAAGPGRAELPDGRARGG
jgi:ethanolamine ammonia-lyase large subunit